MILVCPSIRAFSRSLRNRDGSHAMNDLNPETRFPRHPYYYIALKLAVLALAIAVAIYVLSM